MTDPQFTPDDRLIQSLDQLKSWIADRPSHLRTDQGCSCGWVPSPGRSWSDHAFYDDINDLRCELAAASAGAGSVVECEAWLYSIIDTLAETGDT